MPTDKYSDDHTIIVKGGTGTFTVNGDLVITGALGSSGDTVVTGDLFTINSNNIEFISGGDIRLDADNDVRILATDDIWLESSGYTRIISDSDIFIAASLATGTSGVSISAGASGSNSIIIDDSTDSISIKSGISSSIIPTTGSIYLTASDDVRIYGGVGTANGQITLSASNGSSPYISLFENTNTLNINAGGIGITGTGTTSISGSSVIITQGTREKTISMPGSSFAILELYSGSGSTSENADLGTGDEFRHTVNGNVYWTMDTSGSGNVYGHVFASLPESIPDGSIITQMGATLDLSRDDSADGETLTVKTMIRSYKLSDGSDVERYAQSIYNLDGHKSFLGNLDSSTTIDKANYAYTIKVEFKLQQGGDRKYTYLTGVRIKYTTTKFDPNL